MAGFPPIRLRGMAGMPSTYKCDNCRKRSVKCDGVWPTCGTCLRTMRVCTGPSRSLMSGHNSFHAATMMSYGVSHQSQRTGDAGGSGCHRGIYSDPEAHVKYFPMLPAQVRRSGRESFTAEFVSVLEATAGTEHDVSLVVSWIKEAPCRLVESAAFCAAASLFVKTWANTRRDLPNDLLLDRRAYGVALYHLRNAINDPTKVYQAETLAATALILKVEVDFDHSTSFGEPSRHAAGLHALMTARGPPQKDDIFYAQQCLEAYAHLNAWIVARGEQNAYTIPGWTKALKRISTEDRWDKNPFKNLFEVLAEGRQWPNLVQGLKEAREKADPSLAVEVIAKAECVLDGLQRMEEENILPMLERGEVWEAPDLDAPWGWAFEFSDWPTCAFLQFHSMISIIIAQLLSLALESTGTSDPTIHRNIRKWSERIWKTNRYMNRFSIGARSTFICGLLVSFRAASDRERDALAQRALDLGSCLPNFMASMRHHALNNEPHMPDTKRGVVLAGARHWLKDAGLDPGFE
ncbi:hypothetical protein F4778DRAFT_749929 [Xylariomycetidae sp. FL2044]|nr:hypothetical protein F4778DRAFT_749929 [Xylariomycetidae sp. FL2044]